MKLIALVLLLSALSSLALTEVAGSFDRCLQFFMRDPSNKNRRIIPTVIKGDQYKTICQYWKGKYRFATLYDTNRRIPVYSAYTFLQREGARDDNAIWKIEPQLDKITKDQNGGRIQDTKEMMESPNRNQAKAMNIINQAVDTDYVGSGYSRGHVFPQGFAADQHQADSTFTLTNAAPQRQDSNEQWAIQVETPMLNQIINNCRLDQNHLAYIVTGVVPGNNWIPITRDREITGVNIPSHYWSAFCCTRINDINTLIGKAYIAVQENFNVQHITIDELNTQLSNLYKYKNFSVFPGLSV